ncbi:hypothetical protein [Virgibacillus sp. DJP39]|uniref:hypothetical protein n=1 Tax=Virgibacillus sp. DJP39 TaxID=3409790 RepID=UPI003BB5CEA0
MMKNKVLLFTGLFFSILLLTACSEDEGINVPVGENGESISVDIDGNEEEGVTVDAKNEDGEGISIGTTQNIPEEFPDEIPLPEEYLILNTTNINDNDIEMSTVSFLTETANTEELLEMYKGFMEDNAYEQISVEKAMGSTVLKMQKTEESVFIFVTLTPPSSEDSKDVSVQLAYHKTIKTE